MTPNKQVSPVIRISQGERDASARATHLEAATRKFLVTTNERKQMSTTTNFKRIALVAVAALGLGVLSSVPANAAVSGVTITVTNGATPLRGTATDAVNSDTGTATGAKVAITFTTTEATDSVTVAFFKKNALSDTPRAYLTFAETTTSVNSRVAKTGATGTTLLTTADKLVAAAGDSSTAGATTYGMYRSTSNITSGREGGVVGANFALFIDTNSAVNGAGTYTYNVVVTVHSGTNNATKTEYSADASIVVSAPTSASTTPSAVYTTFFANTSDNPATEGELLPGSATATTTPLAYFEIDNRNASNVTGAKDTITATVSGPGLLYNQTQAAYGKSLTYFQTGTSTWTIVPDGNAGIATVTFKTSITGLTWTRTVNFYASKATTITAANFHPVLKVGTNIGAVAVSAKDSLGNAWTGTAYIYASSAADALVAGSETPVECAAYNSTTGILCPVTTLAIGTAKLKVIDAATVAAASATSNEVTVTVKSTTAAGVKIAFNKATYTPGEKALLTVTPVDAAGANLPTVTITDLLAAGGITSSLALGSGSDTVTAVSMTTSAYSSATSNLVAGARTYVVYMPVNGGTVKVTATGGAGLPLAGQVDVSATATVTDNAAAALAAVTALATTVASLKTLITTLTNLVLKIQKKVKA